jgi:lipoprotein-anchoring transpeptidase ErfK/SrfK
VGERGPESFDAEQVQPEDFSADPLVDDRAARPVWQRPAAWTAAAVVVAALSAGVYVFRSKPAGDPAAPAGTPATASRPAASDPGAPRGRTPAVEVVEDLAPGVDGGSTDAGLPFFFRRQPVFYRTSHPTGTIIVDRGQRFLYLIQPNNVALRYGIGLGTRCATLAGLRRVTNKAEWPEWQPEDAADRRLVKTGTMPGGPGNPLGARVFDLDDNTSRIHGTNAPKTIGNAVARGCLRLVNDDIVDLYGRVPLGTRVIISD